MRKLKVLPLLWKGADEVDPFVHLAARRFANENLSNPPEFENFMRTWLLAECDGPALVEPWGLIGLRMVVDCPLFHMRTPEKNREAIKKFSDGYKLLSERARVYLEDQGFSGQEIFIHVSEESENATMVKYMTKRLGLQPSHRLRMEV